MKSVVDILPASNKVFVYITYFFYDIYDYESPCYISIHTCMFLPLGSVSRYVSQLC